MVSAGRLHTSVEPIYRIFLLYDVTSRDVQNIADPWKDSRSFVDKKIRALHDRHLRKWGQRYYVVLLSALSPFHGLQNTWPWTILNGHNFTLNFHYYKQPFENFFLHTYYWACLCGQRRCAEADRDLQNIWDLPKYCGSFVDVLTTCSCERMSALVSAASRCSSKQYSLICEWLLCRWQVVTRQCYCPVLCRPHCCHH